MAEAQCGPGADARYCPQFWSLTSEVERLRAAVRELLESTGLDDEEQARWLDMAGIPDEDEDEQPASEPSTRQQAQAGAARMWRDAFGTEP